MHFGLPASKSLSTIAITVMLLAMIVPALMHAPVLAQSGWRQSHPMGNVSSLVSANKVPNTINTCGMKMRIS